MSHDDEVLAYFADKAEGYDLVEHQHYWRLSDELLWHLLTKDVLAQFNDDFSFLDAGGGTGRWSMRLLDSYSKATGTIYDLSPEMLEQAKKKVNGDRAGRLQIINGDITDMFGVPDEQFDVTYNFHNVLGFVDGPERALAEMGRVTRKGGYVVSVVPNKYHLVFFNLQQGNVEEAEKAALNNMGRFTQDMPAIRLFTPHSLSRLYGRVGLEAVFVKGFPVTIYPGYQETRISGDTASLKDILSGEESYGRILAIEKNLVEYADAAARGNNLLMVGKKS
ncbi:class I SAM-dependent methyltransferase [Candidatus Woesearchaeota archaeon]|nr:class I SAM-dependent methyltransferase [Candidatus Woesearchaeota archaeon]